MESKEKLYGKVKYLSNFPRDERSWMEGFVSAEKRIKDKYNDLNSKLKEETNPKLTKRLNLDRIQELEIQVKLLKELLG